jgi:hypothetical protein
MTLLEQLGKAFVAATEDGETTELVLYKDNENSEEVPTVICIGPLLIKEKK